MNNIFHYEPKTTYPAITPELETQLKYRAGQTVDKGITIGDNTAIGGNCKILDNDFHPIEAEERVKLLNDPNGGESEAVPSKEISIGKNCFVGCNSIILKGTVLGDNCVVGAGAVVSGKFEPNSVIVGNPARVIRTLGKTDGSKTDGKADGRTQ